MDGPQLARYRRACPREINCIFYIHLALILRCKIMEMSVPGTETMFTKLELAEDFRLMVIMNEKLIFHLVFY